jgi:hypothetical protein
VHWLGYSSLRDGYMNEQRAFGCMNCFYFDDDDMCEHPSITAFNWCKAVDFVRQNKNAITPSCPMWNEAKPTGELK